MPIPPGRPRIHATPTDARATANAKARETAKSRGLVQRSLWLSQESWEVLRQLRLDGEKSYSETLNRIIGEATSRSGN